MEGIVPALRGSAKDRLLRRLRECRDMRLRTRYLNVIHLVRGRSAAETRVIHVILDNDSIHSTQQVEVSLQTPQGQRLRLHFLPPDCPDHNRIERVRLDLHAHVARNHTGPALASLMHEVRTYLQQRNRRRGRRTTQAA